MTELGESSCDRFIQAPSFVCHGSRAVPRSRSPQTPDEADAGRAWDWDGIDLRSNSPDNSDGLFLVRHGKCSLLVLYSRDGTAEIQSGWSGSTGRFKAKGERRLQ